MQLLDSNLKIAQPLRRSQEDYAELGFKIPLKENGAPDLRGHLARVAAGQKNILTSFTYSGSYSKDFAQADKLAGFTKDNPRPANTIWHHVEDYNAATNSGTMELVDRSAHQAATPHSGGAAQYRAATGKKYK